MPKIYAISRRPIFIPIGPSIAYIPLNRGMFSLIDRDDVDIVAPYNWHAHLNRGNQKHYAYSHEKTAQRKTVSIHRLLVNCESPHVDHRNGNTLDNRRCNLRACTVSQNLANQGIMRSNTTGYKGVSFHIRIKKFGSSIRQNGKSRHLGYFSTPEEAHLAYRKAAEEIHGEFARFQ